MENFCYTSASDFESRADLVHATVAALTPRQRQVFCLHVTHELTTQETAKILGLANHSTVSHAMDSARKRLRSYLDGDTSAARISAVGHDEKPLGLRSALLEAWIGAVGVGEISPMREMNRPTHEALQRWLAANGDVLLAAWFDRKDGVVAEQAQEYRQRFAVINGGLAEARHAEYPFYEGSRTVTRFGKVYEMTPEENLERRGGKKRPTPFSALADDEGRLVETVGWKRIA